MALTVPLVLPTGSSIGRSGQAAYARLVNAYAEPLGKDGKAPFAVYASPGNLRWDSGSYTGACRGLIELSSSQLIAILGNEVISFDVNGVGTAIDALVGTKRLHFSRNRNAAPQITMITESKQVFVLQSGVITQVTDPDLPAPVSTAYLSGYTLYGIEDGRIFASALEDSTSIAAGAFGNSKADDSKLVRVFPDSNYLYVFNAKGTEIWQPNANAPNPDFPFSPIQQNMTIGCGAAHSVTSLPGRGMAWVDNERIVRMGRDNSAARISSHSVERALQSLSAADLADVYGFYYTFEGHEIYHLVSAFWSWEFDLTYGEWLERETYGRSRCRIHAHETFDGKHIVGSDEDGKLFQIDMDTYTDDGDPLVYEAVLGHSHRFPGSMIVDQMFVDVIGGVGLGNDPSPPSSLAADDYAVILMHFDKVTGALTDSGSDPSRIWTAAGSAAISSAQSRFGGWSMALDGLGSYVSSPDSADFSVGSGDFTVDFWFNTTLAAGAFGRICGQGGGGGFETNTSFRILRTLTGTIDATVYVGATPTTVASTTTFTNAVNTGFHHVALVRSGGTLRLFIDGIQEASAAIAGSINNSTSAFTIGTYADSGAGFSQFAGWIDDFRFSVGIARWTSAFTPPAGLTSPNVDPMLMIDYSDDGGANFEGERLSALGRQGERTTRVQENGWGLVDNVGRLWRFRVSAAVLRGITKAALYGRRAA